MNLIWILAIQRTAENALHACIDLPETRLQPTAAKAWGWHLILLAETYDSWRYVIWLSATISS